MESSSATYALVLAFLALFFWALNGGFRLRRRLNLPPSPKPWPIIGNLDVIGHLPIHPLSLKNGPLKKLRFRSFPVVASSLDKEKQILKNHDLNFAFRPKTAAGKYPTYNYSDITWSSYGPYWRQARKMCLMVMELFSSRRLDSYEYIRAEEIASSGRTILLKSLNVISVGVFRNFQEGMVLGRKYSESETSVVSIKKMMDDLFLLNRVLKIRDSIPWLGFLNVQGYVRRMKGLCMKGLCGMNISTFLLFLILFSGSIEAKRHLEGERASFPSLQKTPITPSAASPCSNSSPGSGGCHHQTQRPPTHLR